MKTKISPNKLSKLAHQNHFPFFTFFANEILKSYERSNGDDLTWKKGITLLERTSIKNLIPLQNEIHRKCLYAVLSQDYADEADQEMAAAVERYMRRKEKEQVL